MESETVFDRCYVELVSEGISEGGRLLQVEQVFHSGSNEWLLEAASRARQEHYGRWHSA